MHVTMVTLLPFIQYIAKKPTLMPLESAPAAHEDGSNSHKKKRRNSERAGSGSDGVEGTRKSKKSKTQTAETVEEPAYMQSAPNVVDDSQIDPQLMMDASANSQASTMSFLSAIVAAATGAPNHPYFGMSQPDTVTPTQMHLQPDVNRESNELVLRALQDFDISKIANVLKTLGEAAAAANIPFGAPPDVSAEPTPLCQIPVSSKHILEAPENQASGSGTSAPAEEQYTSSEHAHLLANKWLNANKLNELVKTQGALYSNLKLAKLLTPLRTGLVYKKGKFSAVEEQQLTSAIEAYRYVRVF